MSEVTQMPPKEALDWLSSAISYLVPNTEHEREKLDRALLSLRQHRIDSDAELAAKDAEIERLRGALKNAAQWHDEADKAISKQPNANVGQNGWMRAQHREQADNIRQALGDSHV